MNNYVIFSVLIFQLSLFGMDFSGNKLIHYSKHTLNKCSNLIKAGCDLLNPTPAQKKQMFSMILMASWLSLAQGLPTCFDLLNRHIDFWENEANWTNIYQYYEVARIVSYFKGCFDICQDKHPEEEYPKNLYMAICHAPTMDQTFGNISHEALGTITGRPNSQLTSYSSPSHDPLFPAKPEFLIEFPWLTFHPKPNTTVQYRLYK